MESALTYTLQRFDWQFFGTLTFKSERLPERVRISMWSALLSKTLRRHGMQRRKVPYVLRQERGEINGRTHFHFLITGLPPDAVNCKTPLIIMAQWEKIGGGMARVREFKSTGHAVDYLLKECLNVQAGANLYEVTKFSTSSDSVLLSPAITDECYLARR